MMRQRQRKNIEELYGGKFDAPKSQVVTAPTSSGQKTARTTERDCGYIISSNTNYNTGTTPNALNKPMSSGKETSRRKSARNSNKSQSDKFFSDDGKGSQKTSKGEKVSFIPEMNTNIYDNKMYCGNNFKENRTVDPVSQQHQMHHQHNHHNHRHSNGHDEDKDDDTDEFFELIRRTVENAIGKSISELLNRNFRELSSKVDRFSAELTNTNALLAQMQTEMNNKIIHYGEENSRHFRYLCMKSEYDKMFYQHQTMIAKVEPSNTSSEHKKPEKRKSGPKLTTSSPKIQRSEGNKTSTTPPSPSCPCRNSKSKSSSSNANKEPTKTSSEDISQKSSEVGMREVLEHIQKFCNQMQINDFKLDQSSEGAPVETRPKRNNIMRAEDLVKINKDIFIEDDDMEEEDDEWEISSDGMTPRNRENLSCKYGAQTSRGSATHRGNNGAGDG